MESYTEGGGAANSISDYGSTSGSEFASFRPLSGPGAGGATTLQWA